MTTSLTLTSKGLDSATALAILTKGSDYLEKLSDIDRML